MAVTNAALEDDGQQRHTEPMAQEHPIDNAAWDARIADAVEKANFGRTLAERGITTVALDEDGRMVEYRPDGTTTVLH